MKRFFARMLLMLSCISVLTLGTAQAAGSTWYDECVHECYVIWADCEALNTNPNRMCGFEWELCINFCDNAGIP